MPGMSGILSGMETVTVRELQKNLKSALVRVQRGATLSVTRRRKVVAQLGPAKATTSSKPWPDLRARAESVLGKRVLKSGAADEILAGRGE
jgi:antitoxin (DNA-binding transcriptional repressor) of toxin-antitoxin stability system